MELWSQELYNFLYSSLRIFWELETGHSYKGVTLRVEVDIFLKNLHIAGLCVR